MEGLSENELLLLNKEIDQKLKIPQNLIFGQLIEKLDKQFIDNMLENEDFQISQKNSAFKVDFSYTKKSN